MFTNQERALQKKIFDSLDKDGDGTLTKKELIMALQRLGHHDPIKHANRIFEKIDLDDNGTIDIDEWCTATMNKKKVLCKNRLQKAYDSLDQDGNGKIDINEIREMFDSRGY